MSAKNYENRLTYHRLNGRSSSVLTATPRSYAKGQISTPYEIKTPERIGMKFGTVDYVLKICLQTKFGNDQISGGFCVNMWNIRPFVTLFFPEPTWRPHPQTNFHANALNNVDSRIDVPFVVKIETFSKPWPPAPKTAKTWPFSGQFSLDFTVNISGT